MAVHIAGLAVGRPAGMTDAAAALGQRQLFQLTAQGGKPPLAFDHADTVPLGKRHTGRIVPAVLQFFQTVQQHLLGAAHANITYNATHTKYLQTDCGAPKCAAAQSVSSIKVYVLVWLSLQGSVSVLLPVFACSAAGIALSRRNIRRSFDDSSPRHPHGCHPCGPALCVSLWYTFLLSMFCGSVHPQHLMQFGLPLQLVQQQ